MPNVRFNESPVVGEVTDDVLKEIAEDARQAFFKVVCDRITELYPGSRTWGDETPWEYDERMVIALRWVKEHATNNENVRDLDWEEACWELDTKARNT